MPGAGLDDLVGGKTSSFKFLRLIMGDGKQWPIKKHFFFYSWDFHLILGAKKKLQLNAFKNSL